MLAPAGVSVMYGPCTGIPHHLTTCLPTGSSRSRRGDSANILPYYSGGSILNISTFEKYWALNRYCSAFALTKMRSILPMRAMFEFLPGIDTIARFHRHFAAILKSHA